MEQLLLEVGVTTADEACLAEAYGADRLELCSVLEVGGVTPSPAAFLAVRDAVAIPVWVLIRPRPGGFTCSTGEFETLKRDAEWFLDHGAAGIVVGVLTAENQIDRERNGELATLAKGAAVFHRAFDFVPDRGRGLEELIDLGFRRVLTSGGVATALLGACEIAALRTAARGRIEILPGGGVTAENAVEVIRRTGCNQVHGSFRTATGAEIGLGMGESRSLEGAEVRAVRDRLDAVQARIASG